MPQKKNTVVSTSTNSSLSTHNRDMDKGFPHGQMYSLLKPEDQMQPCLRQPVLSNQCDSVESDTESLAQERAYQQQLQIRIGHYDSLQNESTDSLDEDSKKDETEDFPIYDSLEVGTLTHAKIKNPIMMRTEYLETQRDEREGNSFLYSDDPYSDLRYDPNWRTNLNGAGRFNESPYISVEGLNNNSKDTSAQSYGERGGQVIKGGYVVVASPAPVVTPHLAGSESHHPYCLHSHNSPEADVSVPSSSSTKNTSHNTSLKRRFRENAGNSCNKTDENTDRSELSEVLRSMHIQEYHQQGLRQTQGGAIKGQQRSTSPFRSPKALSNKKPGSLMEDIVERNKVTLGRVASKPGSYLKVHALQQEIPHPMKKVSQKKAQQTEYNNPCRKQQTPAPGVKTEPGDCLGSPLAAKPAMVTSLQPSSPAIHLNIHLSSPSHLLPLLQQTGQDAIINLACLHGHGHSHWNSTSEAVLSPRKSSFIIQGGLHTQLQHQFLEFSPEQLQRVSGVEWLSASERENQMGRQNEVHNKQFTQSFLRTTTTSSQASGPNMVLPPIGKSGTRKGTEETFTQSVESIHTNSSDGYLVQMEKHKQMKARVTYKAYSLKDYKQLRSDIKLQGLGPDYSVTEKTKMKRQKLYSNLIREQNKKISRIPFLPTKDQEGNDKKVPRMKALEYAKTIAKPSVQLKPKQTEKHRSEDITDHQAPLLEGMDMSQLATLELLRRRHEEERQAVALFRKVHAV